MRRIKVMIADPDEGHARRLQELMQTLAADIPDEEVQVELFGPISDPTMVAEAALRERPDCLLLEMRWGAQTQLIEGPHARVGKQLVAAISRACPEMGILLTSRERGGEAWREYKRKGALEVFSKAELFDDEADHASLAEARGDFLSAVLAASRTAADYFVECMRRQRVRFVFGVPGGEVMPIIRGIEKAHLSGGMEFILTATEQGAAFMADTIGRLSPGRIPGVCLATLGPGATNLLTGVANAWEDKSPVIVLTGQAPAKRSGKESHQSENTMDIFNSFTTYRKRIETPAAEEIASTISIAFRSSRVERPRPALIEIPVDVQKSRCHEAFAVPVIDPYGYPDDETGDPLHLPRASVASLAQAAAALAEAKRPVLLIGPGAARPAENQGQVQTARALTALAEAFRIPVAHTFMGKGVVDEQRGELVMPVAGSSQSDMDLDLFNRLFDASDLVLTVGYDFHEFDAQVWNRFRGHRPNQQNIIHISFLEPQVETYYAPRFVFTGSIAGNVHGLLQACKALEAEGGATGDGAGRRFPWRAGPWSRLPMLLRKQLAEEARGLDRGTGRIGPQDLIQTILRFEARLLEESGRNLLLISDTGLHKMWLARHFPSARPNGVLIPNGFSPMGYAIPAAIGAAFLHKQDEAFRRKLQGAPPPVVLAVIGDGCFRMSGLEFGTAVRYGLPILVVVVDDAELGLISAKERASYGTRTARALDLPACDYAAMARAMGGIGYAVPGRELRGCLDDGAAEPTRPTLIHLKMDQGKIGFDRIVRRAPIRWRCDLRDRLIQAVERDAHDEELDALLRARPPAE